MSNLGAAALPQLLAWQIAALPEEPIVSRRIDPLLQLAASGVPPLASQEAHREREVSISYIDSTGTPRGFRGDPAVFDRDTVRVLVSVSWVDPDTGELLPSLKLQF